MIRPNVPCEQESPKTFLMCDSEQGLYPVRPSFSDHRVDSAQVLELLYAWTLSAVKMPVLNLSAVRHLPSVLSEP